jgi:hypothetical protein
MATSPTRKKMRADLECNQCQYQFEGYAWFVSIGGSDLGSVEWVSDTGGAEGNVCPGCDSALIRVQD